MREARVALLALAAGCTGMVMEMPPPGGDAGEASENDAGPAPGADAGPAAEDAGGPPDAGAPALDPREGPGVFVAVGYSLRRVRSVDGVDWTDNLHNGVEDTSKGNLLRDIVASEWGLLAVGTNKAFYSEDGVAWTESMPEGGYLGGVAWGNGVFVAAGGNGNTVRSRDGLRWEPRVIVNPRTEHFRGIAFGGGLFLAVGDDGRRAVSADGVSWDHVVSGGAGLQFAAFGEGRFVAAGHGGRRVVTEDGADWTEDVSDGGESLRDVIYAQGRFYAIGTRRIFISDTGDADDWEEHALPAYYMNVAYGDGRFVAVASGNRYLSYDGVSWEQTASGGPSLWSIDFLPTP